MEAAPKLGSVSTLDTAKRILGTEANALLEISERLGDDFVNAVHWLAQTRGSVVVTGMGKAGLIGQKISATLCSTGTRSFFLHPAEAIHGDLGRLSKQDAVLALSKSGETEELLQLLPSLNAMSAGMVAITSSRDSSLGRASRLVIELGPLREAGANRLAPSTSTTAMLALGDAVALTLSERRGFQPSDFAQFHPGGSLGRKLTQVTEIMRPLHQCRVASERCTVRQTFVAVHRAGRRTGAVMIVDDAGSLAGVFTDSDLARLLESQADDLLDLPVGSVMTKNPISIRQEALMPEAVDRLAENQISELPVIDSNQCPVGMIDITDVIGSLPGQDVPPPSEPHFILFPRTNS